MRFSLALFLSVLLAALASCKKSEPPPAQPAAPKAPVAASQEPSVQSPAPPAALLPTHDDQGDADDAAAAQMLKDAIPGKRLLPFVPDKLAGVARSNLLDQAYASAAAYRLEGGGYANLDIKNTFFRGTGDSTLEDLFARNCPKTEKVGGYSACVKVRPDRASMHWYLPDRLTVDLSSPDEALTRKMAKDLRLADLANLSAAK